MAEWTIRNIPRLDGKLAVVTGVGGLGFETARALHRAGCRVILAGRDPGKGAAAVAAIMDDASGAEPEFEGLDLADLSSIKAFADRLRRRGERIDILVNNAGVMAPPERRTTADGFELQFGTNYLGHFALTGRLLPTLRAAGRPRVVTVSSGAHHVGRLNFEDLQGEGSYRPFSAYAQSKLADLMFALELQRRSEAAGWGLQSIAAHPGFARTDIIANGPGPGGAFSGLTNLFGKIASQSAAEGALPILYAATDPAARPGGYYGPTQAFEMKGPPGPARVSRAAQDEGAARRLWTASEEATGVTFAPDGP